MQKPMRVRVSGALLRDDKLLLVQHSKDGRDYYLLPGGGADGGVETISDSLQREFLEELGLVVKVRDLVLIAQSVEPSGSRNILHLIFLVEGQGEPVVGANEDRVSGFLWFSVQSDPKIIDFRPNILADLLELLSGNSYNRLRPLYPRWVE